MTAHINSTEPPQCDLRSDTTWNKLSLLLRPLIKRWVYRSHVPSWRGQELDVVEDILQESLFRIFKYAKKAECGEVAPIELLERISIVIAHNCCKDMRRKDQRLTRFLSEEQMFGRRLVMSTKSDASEIAFNNLFREWLYIKLSQDIIRFPEKQRRALFVDLANLMHFDEEPTPLQQAFLNQKIRLQDFQQPLPANSVERSRHASLVSLAYRRVSKLSSMKPYVM
jgi:DNA-directed RNA polymerase specialized sigma24 family protein